MFSRLPDVSPGDVAITIDGAPLSARTGDTVAAALMAAGFGALRTTAVSGAPRAPFCMMGTCFECLVTIDGRDNQQACMITVASGMRIATQHGARALRSEDGA